MIYFTGCDGTGKTTHAKLVLHYLTKIGIKAVYTNVKIHHVLSYILLTLWLRYNNSVILYIGSKAIHRARTAWLLLELLSIIPALLFRVFIYMALGYIIVCDRYVVDTITTLSLFLNYKALLHSSIAIAFIKLVPKQSLVIFLDADTNTILNRKYYEALTHSIVDYYRKAYSILFKMFRTMNYNVIYIRTDKHSIAETFKIYVRYLKQYLHA